MIIHSDWHMHSDASYDSALSLEEIAENAKKFGFRKFGITDHANFNDEKFRADIRKSVEIVSEFQKHCPEMVQGIELTPIEKPEFDYIAQTGTREGYVPPVWGRPYDIELAQTKEEMIKQGIRYAIGAAHWRVDMPNARSLPLDRDEYIREWHRLQLWLAQDERVTILGHPWWCSQRLWYEDFSVIPRSMNMELAAALKENKKYVECNLHFFRPTKKTEKFRCQYAEFLRELHEMGIPVTYGSDSHNVYSTEIRLAEKYLADAGFKDGDIAEIKEEDLW